MNKCSYFKIRHHKGEIYYYCSKVRKNVQKDCFRGCLEKEYKVYKSLKKKTGKQRTLEDNRYSILQENLSKCFFCLNRSSEWHELLKGRNRKKCIKWGLCVKICRNCHERTENDSLFYQETRKIAQKSWENYYNKTAEEFIKEFGKNYLA